MFKVDEITGATSGTLIFGPRETVIRGISIDSRTIKPGEAFIAIKGNNFDGHEFTGEVVKKGASALVVHEGQPKPHTKKGVAVIRVKDTTKALGGIARFHRRRFNIPVIAVTGSNGKTTTKEMAAHVLSKKFKVLKSEGTENNHIGVPLTLLRLCGAHDIAIIEIGTNHFGEVEYLTRICEPNMGIITSIGPSHLEFLGGLGGVLREKYKMVENLQKPRIAILNADNRLLKDKVCSGDKETLLLGFGLENACDFSASGTRNISGKVGFRVNKKYKFTLNTFGYYNIYNALAAVAAGRIFGLTYTDISRRLSTFDFPAGRLKFKESNGIKFIDDTYNSNPLSLGEALKVLADYGAKGRKVFVMGDMLELGKRSRLFHYQAGVQASGSCDVFVTVGSLSKFAARGAKANSFGGSIFICENCSQAREILFNRLSLKKGDIVLIKGSRSMNMEKILGD